MMSPTWTGARKVISSIAAELDYRIEARNLERLARELRGFDRLVVPLPVHDYTRQRVLTMDYVRGRKVTDVGPLARLELDGEVLVDQLLGAYLEQVLVHGFFHADPHPGNVFVTGWIKPLVSTTRAMAPAGPWIRTVGPPSP